MHFLSILWDRTPVLGSTTQQEASNHKPTRLGDQGIEISIVLLSHCICRVGATHLWYTLHGTRCTAYLNHGTTSSLDNHNTTLNLSLPSEFFPTSELPVVRESVSVWAEYNHYPGIIMYTHLSSRSSVG